LKALIIEDNPGDSRLIREHLHDFECIISSTLSDGLKQLDKVDIIVLDLGLPDAKPRDAIKKISESISEGQIVIIVTGMTELIDCDYISKSRLYELPDEIHRIFCKFILSAMINRLNRIDKSLELIGQ